MCYAGKGEDDAEYVPQKPESVKHVEEGSFYSVRCCTSLVCCHLGLNVLVFYMCTYWQTVRFISCIHHWSWSPRQTGIFVAFLCSFSSCIWSFMMFMWQTEILLGMSHIHTSHAVPFVLRGIMCPWFNFWFWHYILLAFPLIFFSSLFPYLSPPLLFFSFKNRLAPFPGWMS